LVYLTLGTGGAASRAASAARERGPRIVEMEAVMSVRPNPNLAMTRAKLLAAAVATAEARTRVQGKVGLLDVIVGRHKDLAYRLR
jgi:hypothetical protein